MTGEFERLVLCEDEDAAKPRIDAVREREIDDAELAPEGDRGLRAPVGELLQARPAAAGQDDGDRVANCVGDCPGIRRALRDAGACPFLDLDDHVRDLCS